MSPPLPVAIFFIVIGLFGFRDAEPGALIATPFLKTILVASGLLLMAHGIMHEHKTISRNGLPE